MQKILMVILYNCMTKRINNNLASGSAWSGRRTVTAFNQVGSNPIGAAKLLEIEILVQNYSPGLYNVPVAYGTYVQNIIKLPKWDSG